LLNGFFIVNSAAPTPASFRASGVVGGLQLGYNWQMAPYWLIGMETDFDWASMRGSATSSQICACGIPIPFSNAVDERLKWLNPTRLRLGVLPMPNLLAYVTGGAAYAQVDRNVTYTMTNGLGFGPQCVANLPCLVGSDSRIFGGWTLGGGLELAV